MQKNSVILLILVSIFCCAQLSAQSAFINEINYLSTNPQHRGLELAGQAGQHITGWSVVIYFADGTVRAVEDLQNAVIPSQQNGYGTVWYEVDQMGGDGGVALLDAGGAVVQFLNFGTSYTSGIVAQQGAAAGMVSDYIGSQPTPGKSLQLVGTGLVYLDFAWSVAYGLTPGSVNTQQILGLLPGLRNTAQKDGKNQIIRHTNQLSIRAFPNPTTDFVQVQWSMTDNAPIQLQLLDAQGRTLQNNRLSAQDGYTTVDMATLPTGTYYLRIYQADSLTTQRIVKQ